MKRLSYHLLAIVMIAGIVSCSKKYETFKGDPMNTKIYTLKNGLKVYMTVNKEEPRLQTLIAVRNGGKNDPADNTGLAHYLEHIMFKGSESFGTSDYAAEKPLLDKIENLYNVYRTKTDPEERKAIYHQIDSLSYAASLISIPNEYDKLMAVIGAQGTNAFTSTDVTCYTEDIPSNQIDNWARIQADRFRNMVIRGFHTELEAVYEEYNMYLNEDSENAIYAIDSVLYKNHPYGLQQVIGTQEHLKNPSITAIKRQKELMYVPNNIAICVSGDFDPDSFVKTIEKYFGSWEPNPDIPVFTYKEEDPITEPVVRHVYGTESEFVLMGWRCPGEKENSLDRDIQSIVISILNNGKCGLLDIDLMQQQKVLAAMVQQYDRTDYNDFLFMGYPKDGQTLEEVKDLGLQEIARLRTGDFDEELIKAAVANFKLSRMRSLESNRSRAMQYVNSFINRTDWADEITLLDRLEKVTKADVMAWASKYLSDNSYVVAYKHLGENPRSNKIVAPEITPIATNRDMQSAFLQEISSAQVKPIEPSFVNFDKDISVSDIRDGIELLYTRNKRNDIATVQFQFDMGNSYNPALDMAFSYLDYLGTPSRTVEEIGLAEYKIAGSHSFSVGDNMLTYSVSGLSENLGDMVDIVEDLIMNAIPDEEILANLKADYLMTRQMSKTNQNGCWRALQDYVIYGPEYVRSITLSDDRLMSMTSEELLGLVKDVLTKSHRILYYGPQDEKEVKKIMAGHHKASDKPTPLTRKFTVKQIVTEPAVYLAPYDSRQFNYIQYSDRGEKFSIDDMAGLQLFNEYFGGGMNTVVFQEMREARALAYSAGAVMNRPSYKDDTYSFYARIGSQNDKLKAAVEAFDQIINDMPQSEKSFEIARKSVESTLRTKRITGMGLLSSYLSARYMGLDEPLDRQVFENLPSQDMNSLLEFQKKWIKDRKYVYAILGDPDDLDQEFLKSLGPVVMLSLDDIFCYSQE